MQLCNRVLIRTQHRLTLNTVYRLTIYTDTSSDKYLNRRINLRLINRRFILRFRLVARLRKYCFISHKSTLNRGWICSSQFNGELLWTKRTTVELTSTFLLYRGLVHHHHEILNRTTVLRDSLEEFFIYVDFKISKY